MNYIYWLSQIQHEEKFLVGNQLYVLSQLLQHGYPILPGFVLSNNLLREFLTESDNFQSLLGELSDSSFNLNINEYVNLQSVAKRSQQIIDRATFDRQTTKEIFQTTQQLNCDCVILQPFLSSYSGQDITHKGFWDSYTCSIEPETLNRTIRAVWSELFTARSLLYRQKLGLEGKETKLNILVRPLIDAYASGIVEITTDLIQIRAVWGHQISLLQGDVNSDRIAIERHTGQILSYGLGHKNYGYQKKKTGSIPSIDCLEAYIPDAERTDVYVLTEEAIALLWQLTRKVLKEQPQIEYFLWTTPKVRADSSLNFLITQFGDRLLTTIDSFPQPTTPVLLPSTGIKPLLTGIPAAPGRVVGQVVVLKDANTQLESIPPDSILVINNITPEHLQVISHIRGAIAETGGKTSHGAIVARELNIPTIVSAVDATNILTDGVKVFLDADKGIVYPATAALELPLPSLSTNSDAIRHHSIATKLMVNLSQPQSIPPCLNLPIDGVGLLRAESMLARVLKNKSGSQWHTPSFQAEFIQSLKESLNQFLAAFAPRPVFYRSLDWVGDDTGSSILGTRGTYSYQLDPTLFNLELNTLREISQEGHHNFNLILPFIRSVEEFKFCYRAIQDAGLTDRQSFQVWIVAEVPSVIWLLPEYIRAGVRGIAIGTNDLTQLLLGVDRNQAHFSQHGLNANHTVVRQAIAKIIAIARENNIDCCICGQAPVEYPDLIDKLVEWGITAISVEPKAVEQTYKAIARAERRILLDSIRFK